MNNHIVIKDLSQLNAIAKSINDNSLLKISALTNQITFSFDMFEILHENKLVIKNIKHDLKYLDFHDLKTNQNVLYFDLYNLEIFIYADIYVENSVEQIIKLKDKKETLTIKQLEQKVEGRKAAEKEIASFIEKNCS